jgi:hypothetical protein
LIFHHRNPKDKDFNISGNHGRSWSKIEAELDKCDLMCHNCHNELHDKIDREQQGTARNLISS